ncbi:hypothetical protein MPDQ_002488 [Monascus purpureus]|uniref:Uncharacterized protein n=1 Tax=Monascus purpureus TaxID=5098 RepID=A0A507QPN4_MONPU|nr:hypothetical protein MPDQ_002488 [Monascus purpureus]BDD63363.1 hypothetical protein MAP00_008262 [Monascus purpureus]
MRQPNFKKRKKSPDHDIIHHADGEDLCTAKPSAVFTPTGGRTHTLSVAIPGSIVANVPSLEQKTYLAGAIARALAVFCVDEVVVFDDFDSYGNNGNAESGRKVTLQNRKQPWNGYTANSDPSHFLAHLLSYLETPPYLRKYLFPMHPNLRTAGMLPSLDMPHHLRQNEWCDYREGVVISRRNSGSEGKGRKSSKDHGENYDNNTNHTNDHNQNGDTAVTVIDTGLHQKVMLRDIELPERARVTVRFFSQDQQIQAEPVHSSTPRQEAGYYWGYYVRRCRSLSAVFTECPFDGGYDLSFGTSERGVPVSDIMNGQYDDKRINGGGSKGDDDDGDTTAVFPDYKHLLVVFGGVAGIEVAVRNDRQLRGMSMRPVDANKLFDYWVNLLPGQGSRTIRTEEAVWLGLTSLRRLVERKNHGYGYRHTDGPVNQKRRTRGDY